MAQVTKGTISKLHEDFTDSFNDKILQFTLTVFSEFMFVTKQTYLAEFGLKILTSDKVNEKNYEIKKYTLLIHTF